MAALPLSASAVRFAASFSSRPTAATSSSNSPSRNFWSTSSSCCVSPMAFLSAEWIPTMRCAGSRRRLQVVYMAPEEEKMTRRSPLDFPIEWERPKPGRRPDIFPQFSPMKTPLPPPLPADPPEEDEEEEEKQEEEEDPEKEEQDNPEKQ